MKTYALAIAALLAAACSSGQPTTNTPETQGSSDPSVTGGAPSSTPPDTSSSGTGAATVPTSQPSAVTTTTSAPSSEPPPAAGPPDAKNGEKLFADNNCNGCHGTKAKPGKKNVFSMKWSDDEKKKAADIIKKGKSPMPGFGDKLSDQQVADLVAFVSTK
jgi:mono/diheme cytochrome c family protein